MRGEVSGQDVMLLDKPEPSHRDRPVVRPGLGGGQIDQEQTLQTSAVLGILFRVSTIIMKVSRIVSITGYPVSAD